MDNNYNSLAFAVAFSLSASSIISSIACIIIGVINIICNLILILCFNLGIVAVFIATISSNLLGSVFLFFRNKIYLYISKQSIDKSTQVDIVKYSLPLVPNGLVWWVINASDRTLITIMINTSANGIYSVSNKFSNIINSLYTIFNMSWMESVSMYINDKDDFLKKAFNTIFNLICSLCLGIISVMFIAFPLLIQEAYIDAYKYIPILIIASVFNMLSSNLSAIYIAKRRTKEIASTTILASIINIVINFVFIKMIGLYAAALSTLFAFFALFIIRYLDVQKYVDIKISNKNILIFTILFALSYLTYVYNHLYLNIIMLVINIVACSLINKNEIIAIIIFTLFFIFSSFSQCLAAVYKQRSPVIYPHPCGASTGASDVPRCRRTPRSSPLLRRRPACFSL